MLYVQPSLLHLLLELHQQAEYTLLQPCFGAVLAKLTTTTRAALLRLHSSLLLNLTWLVQAAPPTLVPRMPWREADKVADPLDASRTLEAVETRLTVSGGRGASVQDEGADISNNERDPVQVKLDCSVHI